MGFRTCALKGSKHLLKIMVGSGIDVNARMGHPEGLPGECSLLHIAAYRGDVKMCKYLLNIPASTYGIVATGLLCITRRPSSMAGLWSYLSSGEGAGSCPSPSDQTQIHRRWTSVPLHSQTNWPSASSIIIRAEDSRIPSVKRTVYTKHVGFVSIIKRTVYAVYMWGFTVSIIERTVYAVHVGVYCFHHRTDRLRCTCGGLLFTS